MEINDRLLSIWHYLYVLFQPRIAIDGMRFETEGRVRNLTRPIWSVRHINHRVEDLGRAYYRDIDQWALTYLAKTTSSRLDADITLQAFQNLIVNGGTNKRWSLRIPGWRFNWQYPQPVITQVQNLTGTLVQGNQYQIRVSGIDFCDNESAASAPLLVTLVSPNNALSIRILRQPFLGTLFKSYNVYVNGHLEVNVLHPIGNGPLYPTAQINTLAGTGLLPKEPSNSVPIRWKFIRVDSYADSIREDEVTDGLFNGYVTLQTSTYQEKDMIQPQPVTSITITQTVLPAVPPNAVVQQYIPPTPNAVRIVNA